MIDYPLRERLRIAAPDACSRQVNAAHAHQALESLQTGVEPTLTMIASSGATSAWPLETWAADLLLTCQVGEAFDDSRTARFAISSIGDQVPSSHEPIGERASRIRAGGLIVVLEGGQLARGRRRTLPG